MTRATLVLAMALVACGSKVGGVLNTYRDAPFTTEQDVRRWVHSSAPGVYFQAISPAMLADFSNLTDGGNSGCPRVVKTGGVTRTEGGCTDSSGRQWLGTLEEIED